jgi:hypothetical protein
LVRSITRPEFSRLHVWLLPKLKLKKEYFGNFDNIFSHHVKRQVHCSRWMIHSLVGCSTDSGNFKSTSLILHTTYFTRTNWETGFLFWDFAHKHLSFTLSVKTPPRKKIPHSHPHSSACSRYLASVAQILKLCVWLPWVMSVSMLVFCFHHNRC